MHAAVPRKETASSTERALAPADGILLQRYLEQGDESAFAQLVERHGSMVMAVCRSRLDDPRDVEDAFQATFLKLVRNGRSIRQRDLVGHWLYRVAHHCALRAGRESAKHRPKGELVSEVAAVESDGELTFRDLRRALFEEINRLRDNDRAAVVLCYLEGLTHEEAAYRLGWPLGTVKGRLSRARDLLRERLTRRGLTLSAVLLTLLALEDFAQAAVSPELVAATVKAAGKILPKPTPAMPGRIASMLSPSWLDRGPVALIGLIGFTVVVWYFIWDKSSVVRAEVRAIAISYTQTGHGCGDSSAAADPDSEVAVALAAKTAKPAKRLEQGPIPAVPAK